MSLQGFINEHHQNKNSLTMIDHLLSLQEQQPEYYTDEIIKGIIMITTLTILLFIPLISTRV